MRLGRQVRVDGTFPFPLSSCLQLTITGTDTRVPSAITCRYIHQGSYESLATVGVTVLTSNAGDGPSQLHACQRVSMTCMAVNHISSLSLQPAILPISGAGSLTDYRFPSV